MHLAKHDMTVTYGGRTFAVRAYLAGEGSQAGWHAVVIENRTPLGHGHAAGLDPAGCFAEAVRFVAMLVDAQPATTTTATA